jgi:CDP-6-deoxy-D-xylo-4-hexulose-3-dehydrase
LFGGNIVLQPAYEKTDLGKSENFPEANKVSNNSFWLGVYPGLNSEMLKFIVDSTKEFLKK